MAFWSQLASATLIATLLSGCIIVGGGDDVEEPAFEADVVSIDRGGLLDAEPGEGVGIFVEYLGNGEWNLWTTCDSELTSASCAYDIYALGPGVFALETIDLEGNDAVSESGDEVYLFADTDFDFDGMTVALDSGEPLGVEVWLDGESAEPVVFWLSGDDVQQGMPTNPTLFAP